MPRGDHLNSRLGADLHYSNRPLSARLKQQCRSLRYSRPFNDRSQSGFLTSRGLPRSVSSPLLSAVTGGALAISPPHPLLSIDGRSSVVIADQFGCAYSLLGELLPGVLLGFLFTFGAVWVCPANQPAHPDRVLFIRLTLSSYRLGLTRINRKAPDRLLVLLQRCFAVDEMIKT